MFTCVFFASDNDECSLGTHNCPQICTNTKGGFLCGCNIGFQLHSDGATCSGECYMKHTHNVHTKKRMYKIIHTFLTI